jgi:hypothetical protein
MGRLTGNSEFARDLQPGEQRTITFHDWDKDRPGQNIIGTATLTRTNRSYAHDLADAYNSRLHPRATHKWHVNDAGQLYFAMTREAEGKQHRDSMEALRLRGDR